MKGWRRALAGACVVACAAVAVVGCGDSSDTSTAARSDTGSTGAGEKVHVAFVCATPTTSPFFAPIEQGAKDAASQVGVDLDYTGLGATVTPPAMAQVLKPAINQHPDVIIACNFFPPAEDPLLRQAVDAGTPVFLTNSVNDAEKVGATASFGQTDFDSGRRAGEEMGRAGAKHAICVNQVPDNPSAAARCDGFVTAMKEQGLSVKTLNLPPDQFTNVTAQISAIKGALTSDDSLDSILTLGSVQASAAIKAVAGAGREGVKIGTFDISREVVDQVASDKLLFAVWQQPYLQGYLPVVAAALYMRHGFTPIGETYTGPFFVTKDNADIAQKALAAGLG